MPWYQKLQQYFPVEEMKSRQHLEALLVDKPHSYRKEEGPHHVMLYVEFDDFVFVDYVFVEAVARGLGVGSELMNQLKLKGKPILLEVEPVDYEDSDTVKRLRFYERQGFQTATRVTYRRPSLRTGQKHPLEILYWAPTEADDDAVFEAMCRIYEDVHCYRDVELYGEAYAPVDDVLTLDQRPELVA